MAHLEMNLYECQEPGTYTAVSLSYSVNTCSGSEMTDGNVGNASMGEKRKMKVKCFVPNAGSMRLC